MLNAASVNQFILKLYRKLKMKFFVGAFVVVTMIVGIKSGGDKCEFKMKESSKAISKQLNLQSQFAT